MKRLNQIKPIRYLIAHAAEIVRKGLVRRGGDQTAAGKAGDPVMGLAVLLTNDAAGDLDEI